MRKLYRIKLSAGERRTLQKLARSQTAAAHKVVKAKSLLLCDESRKGPGLKAAEIVAKIGIKPATLERLRKRCCEVGPLEALERKEQGNRSRKFTGEEQARLTALACSEAPEGHARWTLRLLADKLVELEVFEEISHEAVRKQLKKMSSSLG
jgi:hypothetical protein